VETFLFRERKERDWMECSLQIDQISMACMGAGVDCASVWGI
jgi:hypothetical protein